MLIIQSCSRTPIDKIILEEHSHPKIPRRRFLDLFLSGTGLAVLGSLLYPLLRYITPMEQEEAAVSSVSLGAASEFPVNSGRVFRFGSQPGIIIRGRDGKFRAFYATCTHLSCIVQYDDREGVIWCACHNGRYDLNGVNISGPPPRPLPPLKVNISPDNGQIMVTQPEASA